MPNIHELWVMDIFHEASAMLDKIDAKCARLATMPCPEGVRDPVLGPELAQLREFAAVFKAQIEKFIDGDDEPALAGID